MKIPDSELFKKVDGKEVSYFIDKDMQIYHRDFGPATYSKYGSMYWMKHGEDHRTNGRSSIYYHKEKLDDDFCLHGKIYTQTKYMSIVL